MEYVYDISGNITAKKYAYTTAASLSGLTYTYTGYGYQEDYIYEIDEEAEYWNDLLVSYNGTKRRKRFSHRAILLSDTWGAFFGAPTAVGALF
jgi:hypothetical protein